MTLKILLSLSVLFSLYRYPEFETPDNGQVIRGEVVFETSNKPVARAHVYIIEGEEEALTDANGHFKIETWQKFPLQLTIKYRDRPAVKVTVPDASARQVIRLKE